MSMFYAYILLCKDGSLYTGITTDTARRLQEHKDGVGGRYTRAKGVVRLVYAEACENRSVASKREAYIKRLSKPEKLLLIKNTPIQK